MVFTALIGTKTLIKYKSASCLYHIDKMQIFSLYNIRFVYGCYFYDFSYIGSYRTHIYNVS